MSLCYFQMKDISHENLNGFVGACVHTPDIYILTHYCPKGSLMDILEHDEIKLDWSFKSSLIHDLANVSLAFLKLSLL